MAICMADDYLNSNSCAREEEYPLAGAVAKFTDRFIKNANGISLSKEKPMNKSIIFVIVFALAGIVCSSLKASGAQLALGTPGATLRLQNSELFTAIPIINTGKTIVEDLTLTEIVITGGTLTLPVSLPFRFGTIVQRDSRVLEADFASVPGELFTPGDSYALTVKGTYKIFGAPPTIIDKFTLTGRVVLAPASPGSAAVRTTNLHSLKVAGGKYQHQPVMMDNDVNTAAPGVPSVRPVVPLIPTPTQTIITPAVLNDPPVDFLFNNPLGLTSGTTNGTVANGTTGTVNGQAFDFGAVEPSGAVSGGGVIFVTANWIASYSTDGVHFTQLDPTKIFPNDAVGYCCDQIVQYVPSIDRFIWLLQGNGYRLAMASPAQIISSKGTAWTYWTLTPQFFGNPKGTGFDYPDLSVGTNELYMSWDAGIPCPAGCVQGYQVARTSLAGIQAGGTITVEWTNTVNGPSSVTWGEHLTQNTGNKVFWAGHDGNNNLRVFSWAEGSSNYFWRDVGISSWANNAPTSTTPDGINWLAYNFTTGVFPRNGIIGATRSGNSLWFAWTAGTDSNFPKAHVEMVEIDQSNNFNLLQQVQIWGSNVAFAYPALATNACTGGIGLSLEAGGNGNYENNYVGFWGDFVVYQTTDSAVGTDRYGDFSTIRQAPNTTANPGNLFAAFGYGFNKPHKADIHYILFGRPASSCKGR